MVIRKETTYKKQVPDYPRSKQWTHTETYLVTSWYFLGIRIFKFQKLYKTNL